MGTLHVASLHDFGKMLDQNLFMHLRSNKELSLQWH